MGYDTKEQITEYEFRATAWTLIRELLGWTVFFVQRREMAQAWADLLDDLATGRSEALAPRQRDSAVDWLVWSGFRPREES